MTTNRRDLKAYMRIDGSGRVVPSTLILRKNMPKVGKWKEVDAHECCNPTTTTTTTVLESCVEYGYLYNWYAVSDVRNIANTGWHAMTWDDMMNLLNYVTGGNYDYSDMFDFFNESYNGGELKDTGIDQWEDPNLYATNEYGFNAVGSGIRFFDGSFLGINEVFTVYTSDKQIVQSELYSGEFDIINSSMLGYLFTYGFNEDSEHTLGRSSRLVSDVPATGLTDGATGTYTGNDGKIYPTVVINEKWWLADNLAETKYRNGDPIPTVEDNATWAGLTTGAKCAYDNNYEYVGCDETAPTTTTTTTVPPTTTTTTTYEPISTTTTTTTQ